MKTYTLTEVQELLRQQREICASELTKNYHKPYGILGNHINYAPSPPLPEAIQPQSDQWDVCFYANGRLSYYIVKNKSREDAFKIAENYIQAYCSDYSKTEAGFISNIDSRCWLVELSPLLPTEEVVTKEDDSQTGLLKNVPEKIYLQIGDIDLSDGDDFKDLDEISWCQNKIHENDIEYHLASVQPKDLASLASHSCTIGNSIRQ